MYILMLIQKYLRRKLAPLFAAMAVTLCTAMVIIVISVMGGFLLMMRDAAQRLTGEVTVFADLTGFAGYEKLAEQLVALPGIAAATPITRSFGLINMDGSVHPVEVVGIDPVGFNTVTGYFKTIHWRNKDIQSYLDSLGGSGSGLEPIDVENAAQTFTIPEIWAHPNVRAGMILGIEITPWNRRNDDGKYNVALARMGTSAVLTVLPLTARGSFGAIEPARENLVVLNEFKSDLHEVDSNRVYVPFETLQRMLSMHPRETHERWDPETGEPIGEPTIIPGRASELMIKGDPGMKLAELKALVDAAVDSFQAEQKQTGGLWVRTWEERHATLLNAVEKEKGLLTVLFGIISLVAITMIAVIFYMIVMEKTRDIGTLRALGASSQGIATIFLGYGLAIGIIGSAVGFALAATIVLNLNEIQDLLHRFTGFRMWDPKIYYFERIPTSLDPQEIGIILTVAVFSSVLGSLLPAIHASRQHPVEALRYE